MSLVVHAADALLAARDTGEDVEVYGLHREVTTVEAGNAGLLRQVDRSEVLGIGVRLVADGRIGYASTTDLGHAGLAALLEGARASARLATPHPDNRLPDPGGSLPTEAAELPASAPLATAVRLTADLARRAGSLDRRVRSVDTASWREEREAVAIVSTRGVRAQHSGRSVTVELSVVGEDADGPAAGYAEWFGTEDGCDVDAVARDAVRSAVDMLGPRRPAPRDLPLLLAPEVSAPLLAALGRALTGPALSGRGPFRPGEIVASRSVSLEDDGLAPASPAAAPFDAEGVSRRRSLLIAAGRIVGALHTTATAPAGQRSTGNAQRTSHRSMPTVGPTTLRVEPHGRAQPLDSIHVRELSGEGSGIRPVTGRVDVGLVAHLVRDGQPAGRLPVLPLSTDLRRLWSRVTAVGRDARVVTPLPVLAPSLLLAP